MPSWSRQRKNGENGEAGGKGCIFCHTAEIKMPHPITGPLLKGRRLGIRRWPGGAACYFFSGFANVTGAAKAAQDGTAAFSATPCHSMWLFYLHSAVRIQPFFPPFPLAESIIAKALGWLFLWNFRKALNFFRSCRRCLICNCLKLLKYFLNLK